MILNYSGSLPAPFRVPSYQNPSYQNPPLVPVFDTPCESWYNPETVIFSQVSKVSGVFRKLFTYSLLCCVIAWLFFSYVPGLRAWLPVVEYPLIGQRSLAWLGLPAALIFLVIQLWLVVTTYRSLRKRNAEATQHTGMRLNLTAEILWTALPIVLTIGLVYAGYAILAAQ